MREMCVEREREMCVEVCVEKEGIGGEVCVKFEG